jgi:putative ABC transport system permease protein
MRMLARITAAIDGWFRPGALDEGVAEELRFHLERQIQSNIDAGMTLEEALRAAKQLLGNVESVREESRSARPGALMHQTARDLAFGVRLLRRSPAFAAMAVAIVALGIGAATVIFSIVYGIVLRPLPYPEADRLVALWTRLPNAAARVRLHPADHHELRANNDVFEDIALVAPIQNFNLVGAGEPERLIAARLSANLFGVLGIAPALGRGFTDQENEIGNERVVLLSDGLWRRRFGADPTIVGRSINLSGVPFVVVGVMRPEFVYPDSSYQLWVPLTINPAQLARRALGYDHLAVARLKPGITIEQAQGHLTTMAGRLEATYPATNRGVRLEVTPMLEEAIRNIRPALYVICGAVLCLLSIACLNLAGLLAARAADRSREFTIRLALGASRGRLTLQALAEVAPVLVIGGVIAVAVARAALDVFVSMAPASLPQVDRIGVNGTVLLFSSGLLVLTGVVAGLLPALQAWRANLVTASPSGRSMTDGRDSARTRRALVVVQIALTLPLLVGASALVRSFAVLMDVDPGFRTDNVLSMHLAIPRSKYKDDQQIARFYTRIIDRVAAIPGVVSAGMVNRLPLSGNNQVMTFAFDGRESAPMSLQSRTVTPDYFRTMSIPVREGRAFTERDSADAPLVGIVDQQLAGALWPGESAVGKRYRVSLPGRQSAWGEIVGVVGNIRHQGLDRADDRQLYFNYHQFTDGRIVLVVRSAGEIAGLIPAVLGAIRELDPEQPVYDLRTMDDVIARSMAPRRLSMAVVTVFATLSLLLASVGLYALVAYGVTQRLREFALRLAMGAGRSDVMRLVMGDASVLAVCGVALGSAGAVALLLAMKSQLFGIRPLDPITFLTATALLVAVVAAATLLPARRAARTDPMRALRAE